MRIENIRDRGIYMKQKRITAVVTALACSAAMLTIVPMNMSVQAAELVSNVFEFEYEGWCASADTVQLSAEESIGTNGSRGMLVSGRKTPEDGAYSFKGLYLVGGQENTYSMQV